MTKRKELEAEISATIEEMFDILKLCWHNKGMLKLVNYTIKNKSERNNKRKELKAKIKKYYGRLKELEKLERKLIIEKNLLCDELEWYTEEKKIFYQKVGRKEIPIEKIVGYVHFYEEYIDEDNPDNNIEKKEWTTIVRIDGKWL